MSYNDDAINYNDQLDKPEIARQTCACVCFCLPVKKKRLLCSTSSFRVVFLSLSLSVYLYLYLSSYLSIDDEDINAHIVTQTLRNLIRSLYVQISAKLLIMSLHSLRGDLLFLSASFIYLLFSSYSLPLSLVMHKVTVSMVGWSFGDSIVFVYLYLYTYNSIHTGPAMDVFRLVNENFLHLYRASRV